MITETLSASRGQRPTAPAISDSALKVVFLTTLYVDVKEPAVPHILAIKKAQSRADKNQVPVVTGFRFNCRDKIEPNLQSQMYVERSPTWWRARFQRDQ
jgi:hypothetical protein